MEHLKIGDDFVIKKVEYRQSVGGAWVDGTIHGYQFSVLVFPEHAKEASYEIGDSRISKFWLQRIKTGELVFNWDRGLDIGARTSEVQEIVDFLCSTVAAAIYDAT